MVPGQPARMIGQDPGRRALRIIDRLPGRALG